MVTLTNYQEKRGLKGFRKNMQRKSGIISLNKVSGFRKIVGFSKVTDEINVHIFFIRTISFICLFFK